MSKNNIRYDYNIDTVMLNKFGKLTPISWYMEDTSMKRKVVICRCDCGREVKVRIGDLMSEKTVQCGHCKNFSLIDNRYGKLIVVKEMYSKNGRVHWLCQCNCGNTRIVETSRLTTGRTHSCGCFNKLLDNPDKLKESGLKRRKADTLKNKIRQTYHHNAKIRDLSFLLSDDEVDVLVYGNCYYCDAKPSNIMRANSGDREILYNGIDRVDNDLGYIIDNCVSCCKKCNLAKRSMSQSEFLELVKSICNHLKLL